MLNSLYFLNTFEDISSYTPLKCPRSHCIGPSPVWVCPISTFACWLAVRQFASIPMHSIHCIALGCASVSISSNSSIFFHCRPRFFTIDSWLGCMADGFSLFPCSYPPIHSSFGAKHACGNALAFLLLPSPPNLSSQPLFACPLLAKNGFVGKKPKAGIDSISCTYCFACCQPLLKSAKNPTAVAATRFVIDDEANKCSWW